MIRYKASGISLLEVLITILVLSIGMLGIAATQIKTLGTAQESYSRSQAVTILEDATSKIRANREYFATEPESVSGVDADGNTVELSNPYTNNLASGTYYKWCQIGATAYSAKNLCTGSCTARELALSDIDNVCLALDKSGLSQATMGASCFDRDTVDADSCSPGSKMTLYLAWKQVEHAGDKQITGTRCQTQLGSTTLQISQTGVDKGFSCAIVELVP